MPQIAGLIAAHLGRGNATGMIGGALLLFYGAVILSFVGGLWWGLASRVERAPPWLWVASIVPSLAAMTVLPPIVILVPLPAWYPFGGLALFFALTLIVDRQLMRDGIAPSWWLQLRVPLSGGMALLTLAAAFLS